MAAFTDLKNRCWKKIAYGSWQAGYSRGHKQCQKSSEQVRAEHKCQDNQDGCAGHVWMVTCDCSTQKMCRFSGLAFNMATIHRMLLGPLSPPFIALLKSTDSVQATDLLLRILAYIRQAWMR